MTRVLYVEDDQGQARLVQRHLRRSGYTVTVAANGEEGLRKLDCSGCDVLIVDQGLPDMPGLEVVRSIATSGALPPTIMVTACGDEQLAVAAMKIGASDYLVKDVDGGFLRLLPAVITSVLDKYRVAQEREQALRALSESEERYRNLFERVPVALYRITATGRMVDANQALVGLLGAKGKEDVVGRNLLDFYAEGTDRKTRQRALEGGNPVRDFESCLRRTDGYSLIVLENATLATREDGRAEHYEGSLQDITDRKKAERKLLHLATHDVLTGLPNRALVDDRIVQAIAASSRSGQGFAVMMLDLDKFKEVNDTLGHDIGDQLLKSIGERISGRLRKSDTVARFGGDEFVVVAQALADKESTASVAQALLQCVKNAFTIGPHVISITTSIGVARFPMDGRDPVSLLKKADLALYAAKSEGGHGFQFVKPGL